ncbi:MAG TPA: hypothetical protein VIC85_13080 [Ktedonobacterales bacterium]|jgi:hypothetical protein
MDTMDTETPLIPDELTELIGLLVGRQAADEMTLHVLVALLEKKGLLVPGELDTATDAFIRDHGRTHFVERWGSSLGQGLYDGYLDAQLSGLDSP